MSKKNLFFLVTFTLVFTLLPTLGFAAEDQTAFKSIYEWLYKNISGYGGMTISLIALTIGLGIGALAGKPVMAVAGVGIAIFTSFGPDIVASFFTSALI